MNFERMNEEHEKIVREKVKELIKFLDDSIPRSKTYSHINMVLNVIQGAFVTIGCNFVPHHDRENFINRIVETLIANFDNFDSLSCKIKPLSDKDSRLP